MSNLFHRKFTQDELLNEIKQINTEITKQIPLIPNRFDQFLTPKGATDAQIDAMNKRYDDLCIEWDLAEVEYYVNKHLKKMFDIYCREHQLTNNNWSNDHKKNFYHMALDRASATYEEICQQKIELHEVQNINGDCFDDDRHGSQLRVEILGDQIVLGLYDWGELSIEPPSKDAIQEFANAIVNLPSFLKQNMTFEAAFSATLNNSIDKPGQSEEVKSHLQRIRKALNALSDASNELSAFEIYNILDKIKQSEYLHPTLKAAITAILPQVKTHYMADYVSSYAAGFFNRIKNVATNVWDFGETRNVMSPKQ